MLTWFGEIFLDPSSNEKGYFPLMARSCTLLGRERKGTIECFETWRETQVKFDLE